MSSAALCGAGRCQVANHGTRRLEGSRDRLSLKGADQHRRDCRVGFLVIPGMKPRLVSGDVSG